MAIRRRKPAEVIDITPLTCAACGEYVEVDDDFCRRCGHGLLDERRETEILEPAPIIPAAPAAPPAPVAPPRKRSRLLWGSVMALVLLVTAGGAFAAWTAFVRPGVGTFDADVRSVMTLASGVQAEQDALDDPSALPEFAEGVERAAEDLDAIRLSVQSIESESYRTAALTLVETASTYLEELGRLASLPAADIDTAQYDRAEELAALVNDTLAQALALRDLGRSTAVDYSPSSLTRVLANLADYRAQILKQRSRIIAANKARSARLGEVRAFTNQMDGIIARYTAARSELADWIQGVDTYGATFDEAYQVLAEQTDRRRQLRTELSALAAPPQFATAKQSLLAIMDQAVAAMEAAYRGIEEYQWDFDYRYLSYDETPGWTTFQSQTAAISDRYAAVLASYSARKDEVIGRLSTKTPLPKVPR